MRAILLGFGAALAIGGAAQAGPTEDLIDELRAACRPGPLPSGVDYPRPHAYGLIKAADVQAALAEVFPVGAAVLVSRPVDATDSRSNAQWLTDRALAATAASKDADAMLFYLARLVSDWSRAPDERTTIPLEAGGLRIVADAGLAPRDVLTRVLAGDDRGLTIVCRYPSPPPPDTPAAPVPKLLVAKTAEGLDKARLKDRPFAEFVYADDRQARVQAWGVQFAVGLPLPPIAALNGDDYVSGAPRLYLAYERKGENDPAADGYANNLEIGGRISGKLALRSSWLGYYAASGAYQTDDDLDSALYAGEVRLDPPAPYIPYHRYLQGIGSQRYVVARARWTAELVADWMQVDDPGEKAALVDKAEYVRLGYDVGLQVLVGPARKPWAIGLEATYSLRDGRTDDGGDAQLFTSTLSYLGSEDANWAFGLSYERGENLTSFESSELWKLVFGLRF